MGAWRRVVDEARRPIDGASLAAFRVVFGVFVAIDLWRYVAYGWVRDYYIDTQVQFTYFHLDFVRPWPGEWMFVHYALTSVVALAVAAGLYYRATSVLLFFGYLYIFLLEQSVYMNHHYLMVLFCFLLMWMPAERVFSVDRRRRGGATTVPAWTVWLIRVQISIVYAYGALAKLNGDWLVGEPMRSAIAKMSGGVPLLGDALPAWFLGCLIAWAGLLIDALLPILLWWAPSVAMAVAIPFHLLNALFLRIGVFSFLMMGALLIFFAPDWPRRLSGRLSGRLASRRLHCTTQDTACGTATAGRGPAGVAPVLIAVYLAVQLLVPLRHWAYPGDVAWTEEGHRFAWRMKLRSKRSDIVIRATDPATGRTWKIDPRADLIPRQRKKLGVFPDILLQYVHWHRDRLREQGTEAEIRVDWRCSLNGHPAAPMVDPRIDLAKVDRTWRPATWILPRPERG